MPKELASDLVKLALFDVVLYIDDSGSMAFEEGGERIEDLKLYVHVSVSYPRPLPTSHITHPPPTFDKDLASVLLCN